MPGLRWPVAATLPITQGFDGQYWAESPGWLQRDTNGKARKGRKIKFAGAAYIHDLHLGIDIACPVGTPIVAPEDGKIVAAGTYWQTGEHWLMLQIRRGTICFFTHLKPGGLRHPVGTRVTRGMKIALTGNSGMSSGPHLHFEVRKGPETADPRLSWNWYRWNPQRLRVGGDLAHLDWINPR